MTASSSKKWSRQLIGAHCNVVRGSSPRPAGSPLYFDGDFLPWITVGDVTRQAGMYLHATRSKLTEEGAKLTRILQPNTLILTNSGATLGVPKIISIEAGANDGIAAFLDLKGLEKQFLFYVLEQRTAFMRNHLAPGNGQPNLNTEIISSIVVPVPPLPEQQKIAAILSTWDRAIELTEKLIAAKQKRKQALMQQLLTGKVRFAEFVKSKRFQRTPVGDMPADWKKLRLDKVVARVKRKNPHGEVHVLTASGEFGLVDQREFFNRSVAGADLSTYYLLKRGEFAYNRSSMKGYPFGAIKRLDRYEQGVLSTLYICFGICDERCDSDYLCHFFEARLLDKQLRGVTQVGGRAHGLLNITDGDFYSMSVVLPSIEEQQKIAAVLNAQTSEIEGWRKKLAVVKQQKKGLMQQLLTGKVRVNVDSKLAKG